MDEAKEIDVLFEAKTFQNPNKAYQQ